jgi:hypothetical protein
MRSYGDCIVCTYISEIVSEVFGFLLVLMWEVLKDH